MSRLFYFLTYHIEQVIFRRFHEEFQYQLSNELFINIDFTYKYILTYKF